MCSQNNNKTNSYFNKFLNILIILIYSLIFLSSPIISNNGILNNIPITFQMSGLVTYTPDSGGATRSGYKLRLGFSTNQWLGI